MNTSSAAASALSVSTPSDGPQSISTKSNGSASCGQRLAEDHLAADDAGQFDLGGGEVDVRRDQPQVLARPAGGRRPAACSRPARRRATATVPSGSTPRWVLAWACGSRSSTQTRLPRGGQGGGQVHGRGRLADPALLVDHRDPSHGVVLASSRVPSCRAAESALITSVSSPGPAQPPARRHRAGCRRGRAPVIQTRLSPHHPTEPPPHGHTPARRRSRRSPPPSTT